MLKEAWLLQALQPEQTCLNPYFNGTFSKSLGFVYTRNSFLGRVLILILMEHAQIERHGLNSVKLSAEVLILILMEHTQRVRYSYS